MLPLFRPTDSKSPFLRTRLMRLLRLPEVKAVREEAAVVVAVDSVAEEERVVTDLLVKVVRAATEEEADTEVATEADTEVDAAELN